ncbi:transposase [Wolbachia endosymbiont of Drosophila ananassae]|nr:transposase [Wolbachia endosymbiont of Drosophila ananassae]RLT61421.1 transposase [Wolbachia endosymbiont of Drosophila ananassae]RLT63294.1 transposase [Wolbachia endosymbiont of Drosophila ananassae]
MHVMLNINSKKAIAAKYSNGLITMELAIYLKELIFSMP